MKKLLFIFCSVCLTFLMSCDKKEAKAYFTGGTPPELTAVTNTGSQLIQLDAADTGKVAIALSWTNPDYTFNYGVNTLDVGYFLEIDTTGSNFTYAERYQTTINKVNTYNFTVGEINSLLTNIMGLATGMAHKLQMRVGSYMVTSGPGADTLFSKAMDFTATPFAPPPLVKVPADGELYIVGGDAKLGNWANGGDFAVQNQKFTQVSETKYTITVQLSGGDNTTDANQFLLVPKWGNWDHKYAVKKTADQPTTGGKFGYDFSDNFPGPPAAGNYRIDMDFQLGTYTVTKL